jgi:hypothetical protein
LFKASLHKNGQFVAASPNYINNEDLLQELHMKNKGNFKIYIFINLIGGSAKDSEIVEMKLIHELEKAAKQYGLINETNKERLELKQEETYNEVTISA